MFDASRSSGNPALQEALVSLSPAIRSAAPLLLLISREELTDREAELARSIAAQVTDWSELRRISQHKLGLPLLYKNVRKLKLLPDDHKEILAMRDAALAYGALWLRLASAQKNFLDTCLKPTEIDHIFFKGTLLGARYYRQANLRIARDIDVVVRKPDLRRLVGHAQAAGYRVILDRSTGQLVKSKRDLEAVFRYKNDVPLLSPEGVHIEVHTDIWHGDGYCDPEALFNATEYVVVEGRSYKSLTTPMLFCYLAYHHNRHIWSHLNWLSDIPAIRCSSQFDIDEVLLCAERLGVRELVEATLAFDDMNRGLPVEPEGLEAQRAAECQAFFALTLGGGVTTEGALYFGLIPPDRDWRRPAQLSETIFYRAWRSRFTPRIEQYAKFPLPLWLHWLYPIQRGFVGAGKRLKVHQGES